MDRLNLYNNSTISIDVPKYIIQSNPGTVYIGLLHLSKYTSKVRKLEYSELSNEFPVNVTELEDKLRYTIVVDSHIQHQSWLGPWDLYLSIRDERQDAPLTVMSCKQFEYVLPYEGSQEFTITLDERLGKFVFIKESTVLYSTPNVIINYPTVSYLGGYVTPSIEVMQIKTIKTVLADGSVDEQKEVITGDYDIEFIEGTVDGTVYVEPTTSIEDKEVTVVKAKVTMNGKETIATAPIVQKASPNVVYVGLLHTSVSHFKTKQEALVSRITSQMLREAIENNHIVKQEISDEPKTVVTTGSKDYFICLLPAKIDMSCKQFDGLSNFVRFSGSPDQYANGDIVAVNGREYKLYAQYAATIGTEFKYIIL